MGNNEIWARIERITISNCDSAREQDSWITHTHTHLMKWPDRSYEVLWQIPPRSLGPSSLSPINLWWQLVITYGKMTMSKIQSHGSFTTIDVIWIQSILLIVLCTDSWSWSEFCCSTPAHASCAKTTVYIEHLYSLWSWDIWIEKRCIQTRTL